MITRKEEQMDKKHLSYILNEISEHKGTPFQMANEAIADEMFPYIQMTFPNALMVKLGIAQYIAVTAQARNTLAEQMKLRQAKHLQEAESIAQILSELRMKKPIVTPITMSP